jgi:fucose permease
MTLKRSVAIYHAVFLVTGIATVMIGVLLAGTNGTDSHAGALMSVQFSGQVLGSLVVTQRPHRTLTFGLLVSVSSAAALAALSRPSEPLLFALGLGLGSVMSSVNTAAGLEVEPARRGSVLELLNVFWPIGAASAPWVEGLFHSSFHVYALIAALFFPCVLWLAITRPQQATLVEQTESAERILRWPLLANLCLIAFLVVGIETAVANWLPTLAQRNGASLALAAAIPTGYWCGSLASRLLASFLLQRIALYRLSIAAAVGTAVACTLIPIAYKPAMLLAVAIAVAVTIAPLYPALLAGCVDVKLKGLIFMSAGLGSAAAPWAVGKLSVSLGSLQRAEWLAALGALIMLISMSTAKMFRPPAKPAH